MSPNMLCFSTDLSSTEMANWVQAIAGVAQAIGAVAAIIVAFFGIRWQLRHTQKSRQKSILAIAEAADEHALRIAEAFAEPEDEIPLALIEIYDLTIIDGVVGALSAAPVHEIGSRDGVIAYLSIRDQFRFLGLNVEAFKSPSVNPDLTFDPMERIPYRAQLKKILADNVRRRLSKIRSDYQSLKASVG